MSSFHHRNTELNCWEAGQVQEAALQPIKAFSCWNEFFTPKKREDKNLMLLESVLAITIRNLTRILTDYNFLFTFSVSFPYDVSTTF